MLEPVPERSVRGDDLLEACHQALKVNKTIGFVGIPRLFGNEESLSDKFLEGIGRMRSQLWMTLNDDPMQLRSRTNRVLLRHKNDAEERLLAYAALNRKFRSEDNTVQITIAEFGVELKGGSFNADALKGLIFDIVDNGEETERAYRSLQQSREMVYVPYPISYVLKGGAYRRSDVEHISSRFGALVQAFETYKTQNVPAFRESLERICAEYPNHPLFAALAHHEEIRSLCTEFSPFHGDASHEQMIARKGKLWGRILRSLLKGIESSSPNTLFATSRNDVFDTKILANRSCVNATMYPKKHSQEYPAAKVRIGFPTPWEGVPDELDVGFSLDRGASPDMLAYAAATVLKIISESDWYRERKSQRFHDIPVKAPEPERFFF